MSSITLHKSLFLGLLPGLCLLASSGLSAQNKKGIVPAKFKAGGNARTLVPFAEQPLHYQQTISGVELAKVIKSPVRLRGLEFRTKNSGNQGVQITVQVVISTYRGRVLNGVFSRNLQPDAQVVVPRTKLVLPTSTGGWDLNLPFVKDWVWNGKDDVIIDVRIYGNGNQNKQFFYWFDSIGPIGNNGVNAHFALGANSLTARVPLTNQGLVTRFNYQEGVVIGYGKGCKGQGGFVPKISVLGLPTVGNQGFRINLSRAPAEFWPTALGRQRQQVGRLQAALRSHSDRHPLVYALG